MQVNAIEEIFEKVTVFGNPMIFTNLRVKRCTVPAKYYLYEVRHDDECQGIPVEVAKWIMVNHWGTLISNRPIRFEYESEKTGNAWRYIEDEDWNYEGETQMLIEYMAANPPSEEEI